MLSKTYRILAINPGSTSTKIGIFSDETPVMEESVHHETVELNQFKKIIDQADFRKKAILDTLQKNNVDMETLDVIVARGGVLQPIPGGTYEINQSMLKHLSSAKFGEHASNLGAVIARQLADSYQIPAYIVDPVVVDELHPVARISGVPSMERKSIFHALNQKAVARQVAAQLGSSYHEMNFIVAHMGGGITVGAHQKGRVIDVNNGLNGEGPFSPERAGTIPFGDLINLSFSGRFFPGEVMRLLVGQGGMVGYLGTNDAREVEKMIDQGNEKAKLVYEAMAYQVAKEIASCAAVLEGNIDRIILTGGLAHGDQFVSFIRKRVEWIAPIEVIAGENELKALTQGALRVLRGEENAKTYPQPVKGRGLTEVKVYG